MNQADTLALAIGIPSMVVVSRVACALLSCYGDRLRRIDISAALSDENLRRAEQGLSKLASM